MARPSIYSEELADEICERLIDGESLRSICRDDKMPGTSTVCRWLSSNESFREQYAHAREHQAETLFDEILDIVDNASNDWMERNDSGNEGWVLNGEHVQRTRLTIPPVAPRNFTDGTPAAVTFVIQDLIDSATRRSDLSLEYLVLGYFT